MAWGGGVGRWGVVSESSSGATTMLGGVGGGRGRWGGTRLVWEQRRVGEGEASEVERVAMLDVGAGCQRAVWEQRRKGLGQGGGQGEGRWAGAYQ